MTPPTFASTWLEEDLSEIAKDTPSQIHHDLHVSQLFEENGTPLTDTQAAFIYDIVDTTFDAVEKRLDWDAVLEGPAGTGKTTVLTALILELLIRKLPGIAVTAPTHKAAQVLNEKIDRLKTLYVNSDLYHHHGDLKFPCAQTIHSLLHLVPRSVADGSKESFYQKRKPNLSGINLVIVDECSMIGTEMFEYIDEARQEHLLGTLLYSGDPYQLPPVNEKQISKSFVATTEFKLTEVLRHDGAILDLATKVRTMRYLPQIKPALGENSEVATFDSEIELLDAWLDELEASKTPENIVLLCWMNKNRRMLNRMARAKLFGIDAPEFQPGDNLVAIKPIMDPNDLKSDKIIYANNASILVKEAEENYVIQPLENGRHYTCWRLKTSLGYNIYVPTKESNEQWLKDISKLGKEISKEVEQTKALHDQGRQIRNNPNHPTGISYTALEKLRIAAAEAKNRWRSEYFPLKNAFADVDFGYAVTIHKSQGSTYETVYVHPDYMKSRGETTPLLYVAVTRASKKVCHLFTGIKR